MSGGTPATSMSDKGCSPFAILQDPFAMLLRIMTSGSPGGPMEAEYVPFMERPKPRKADKSTSTSSSALFRQQNIGTYHNKA